MTFDVKMEFLNPEKYVDWALPTEVNKSSLNCGIWNSTFKTSRVGDFRDFITDMSVPIEEDFAAIISRFEDANDKIFAYLKKTFDFDLSDIQNRHKSQISDENASQFSEEYSISTEFFFFNQYRDWLESKFPNSRMNENDYSYIFDYSKNYKQLTEVLCYHLGATTRENRLDYCNYHTIWFLKKYGPDSNKINPFTNDSLANKAVFLKVKIPENTDYRIWKSISMFRRLMCMSLHFHQYVKKDSSFSSSEGELISLYKDAKIVTKLIDHSNKTDCQARYNYNQPEYYGADSIFCKDFRTPMKIGKAYRLLTMGIFDDVTIEDLVDRHKNQYPYFDISKTQMHIATTPEEIEYAFSWQQADSENISTTDMFKASKSSCMRYPVGKFRDIVKDVCKDFNNERGMDTVTRKIGIHPSTTYHSPDFYVIYLTNSDDPLCIKESTKLFSRSVIGIQNPENPRHTLNAFKNDTNLDTWVYDSTWAEQKSLSVGTEKELRSTIGHVMGPIYSSSSQAQKRLLSLFEDFIDQTNEDEVTTVPNSDTVYTHKIYTSIEYSSFKSNRKTDDGKNIFIDPYPFTWEGLLLKYISSEKSHNDVLMLKNSSSLIDSYGLGLKTSSLSSDEHDMIQSVNFDYKFISVYIDASSCFTTLWNPKDINDKNLYLLIFNNKIIRNGNNYSIVNKNSNVSIIGKDGTELDNFSNVSNATNMRDNHQGSHSAHFSFSVERECVKCKSKFTPSRRFALTIDEIQNQFVCNSESCNSFVKSLYSDELLKITCLENSNKLYSSDENFIKLQTLCDMRTLNTTLESINEFIQSKQFINDTKFSAFTFEQYGIVKSDQLTLEKSSFNPDDKVYGFKELMLPYKDGLMTINEAFENLGYRQCSYMKENFPTKSFRPPEELIAVHIRTSTTHIHERGYIISKDFVEDDTLNVSSRDNSKPMILFDTFNNVWIIHNYDIKINLFDNYNYIQTDTTVYQNSAAYYEEFCAKKGIPFESKLIGEPNSEGLQVEVTNVSETPNVLSDEERQVLAQTTYTSTPNQDRLPYRRFQDRIYDEENQRTLGQILADALVTDDVEETVPPVPSAAQAFYNTLPVSQTIEFNIQYEDFDDDEDEEGDFMLHEDEEGPNY